MALTLITDATGQPVSVDDVKEHLRVESTSEDYLLEAYIKVATKQAEHITKRAFMPQTWMLTMEDFPENIVDLPKPPLSTASGDITITYLDIDGNLQTLGSSVFTVDYRPEPGRVYLSKDQDWPNVYDLDNNPNVRIQFKCGYPLSSASTGGTVPDDIKHWIMLRVGQMYEYREPILSGIGPVNEVPRTFIDGLLDPYRIIEI